MIITGVLTAIGIFIIMWRIGLPKFCGYLWQTDTTLMILLMVIFFGTFSGMMTGLIAGIILSGLLSISKKLGGAKKLKRSGKFIAWKDVPK